LEITVPLGPQHPALKEPANYIFKVDGEIVTECVINQGYNHRGIEKAFEARDYNSGLYLAERICGICSITHNTCMAQGVEELLGIVAPRKALLMRCLMGEAERVHSHLLLLGVAAHLMGFDTMFMYIWRDRELIMDILEEISGNRVNYCMNTVGGVRRDLSENAKKLIFDSLPILEERTKYYLHVAENEPTFLARTQGVGMLPKKVAKALCAVGPTARGSGVEADIRKTDPYAAYPEIPFDAIVDNGCDALARLKVRILELFESYKIMRYCVENWPKEGDIRVKAQKRVPAGEVVSKYEAPRGEDIFYIKSNGSDKPERIKVRAPTMANLPATEYMTIGGYLADLPITLGAIDPCFSCTDRVMIVKEKSEDVTVMEYDDLIRYAKKYYENPANRRRR